MVRQPTELDAGLSAAILTGGASRRMGADKALLDIGGRPQLARVVDVVQGVTDDVFLVGERAAYHAFGVPVVRDRYPGAGPLGGIATALHHARNRFVLVVGCDMPLLSAALLAAMAREPRDFDVLVPLSGGDADRSAYETLHAIYAVTCLPAIERRLARNDLQVAGLYSDVHVRELDPAWVKRYDPLRMSFVNANDPIELQRVRRLLQDSTVRGESG